MSAEASPSVSIAKPDQEQKKRYDADYRHSPQKLLSGRPPEPHNYFPESLDLDDSCTEILNWLSGDRGA
jgi:hypothetical protein